MALYETEGMILKSYGLAEADKIVVVFTEDEGLVRGVAKGAKRLKSRFGGGLEPFSIVNLHYFQKEERELVSINSVETVRSFFYQATEPQQLQKFAYMVDLLAEFAPPHEANPRLYRMAKICFETAAQHADLIEHIVLYFEIWILRFAGFLPDWTKCERCARSLGETENATLNANSQLICNDCQRTKGSRIVSAEQRKIFQQAQKIAPAKFIQNFQLQIGDVKEISNILRKTISHILGRELLSEKILAAATNT